MKPSNEKLVATRREFNELCKQIKQIMNLQPYNMSKRDFVNGAFTYHAYGNGLETTLVCVVRGGKVSIDVKKMGFGKESKSFSFITNIKLCTQKKLEGFYDKIYKHPLKDKA